MHIKQTGSSQAYVIGQHANEIPCKFCGADVDSPCVTATGKPAQGPHAERYKRSRRLDSDAVRRMQWEAEDELRRRRRKRVAELQRIYGPRWRYADNSVAGMDKSSAEYREYKTWPDGPPDEQEPGDWYCYCPSDGPMERRMFLGDKFDPYHGPVLATITESHGRFRWEVAYSGPTDPYDEYDLIHEAAFCDRLSDARTEAESEAWRYLEAGWPELAAKIKRERDRATAPVSFSGADV